MFKFFWGLGRVWINVFVALTADAVLLGSPIFKLGLMSMTLEGSDKSPFSLKNRDCANI